MISVYDEAELDSTTVASKLRARTVLETGDSAVGINTMILQRSILTGKE